MSKHIDMEINGKSFLYIFFENDKLGKAVKIGTTSHAVTDKAIELRKRFTESEHPVTIQRRLIELQTGSPRKIQPLAYFLYSTKKEARSVENKLHNHFEAKRSEHSKEWFNLSKEDLMFIISCLNNNSEQKIAECAQTETVWVEDENLWRTH
jgi:hypothetical protein